MPQDFSCQNLRGRSFRGKNLNGVNFSGADIRGADFTGANLIGANFSHAKAGIERRWEIGWLIIFLMLSIIPGFCFQVCSHYWIDVVENYSSEKVFTCIGSFITLLAFFILTLNQGLIAGFKLLIVILTAAVASAPIASEAVLASGAVVAAVAGVTSSAVIVVGVSAVVNTGAIVGTIVVTIGMALLAAKGKALVATSILTIILAGVSAYIGWRALLEDKKYVFIRTLIIEIVARDGTNFRQSNLTNTNFSEAVLKNTNFSEANLTRTVWFKAQLLALAKVGNTYLKDKKIRQLLVMGEAQEKNFEREDLREVNLSGANLSDVSFIGADLSEANLQYVDLSRAKLVQTQLDGTDFTGATLTGAFIEDWNITTDTKFDGVRCEYVYMHLPTAYNPDPHRKPDNRQEVFAPGEFGDFIKPIFDTLDLYHSQGVDPRAIAISFKQLAENHPDAELEIVAMEKKGQDKFLLRAKTAATADKSELSAEYFSTYNQLKALADQEVQKLIAEKDKRITDLQNMIVTALQRPSFYAQTYQNQGDTIMAEGSKKQSNFDLKGAQFAGGLVNADTVNANQIGGNITNYSPEQRQNLAEAAAEIQQLLNQLGQSYPTNTPLEKQIAVTEALKQIDNNPTLKARVIGALKSGGTEALKELVDHPLVNILLATLEGWQDAE